MMIQEFSCIIITSDEPYSNMWHTQLLYADYLSSENEVIYIEPPAAWNFRNLFLKNYRERKENKVRVFSYLNRLPAVFSFFQSVNEKINENLIKRKLKKEGHVSILIWHFDSYRSGLSSDSFRKTFKIKRIYHVIDPFYNNPLDKKLRDLSDLIVVTSPRIVPFYESHKHKVLHVPQSLNVNEHRKYLNGSLPPLFNTSEPYVVLLGTFSHDIDYSWLVRLMDKQICRLILIGRVVPGTEERFNGLRAMKGVEYLGEKPPSGFYPIIHHASAGLVIYNKRRRTNICSPLKVLNYLIAGKPVITNTNCEVPQLEAQAIRTVKSEDEFISAVERLKDLAFSTEKVRNYLNTIDIHKTVQTIASKLNASS